ncbi:choline dehydrogenase-like flavoprotein [Mucilaginibacter sp. UYP25]
MIAEASIIPQIPTKVGKFHTLFKIAEASIIPQIPTANTNATTIMIAEFASEILLGLR